MSFSSLLSFIIMFNRVRCGTKYHKLSGIQLPAFALVVKESLKKNDTVFNPDKNHLVPVSEETLESSISEMIEAYQQYKKGGKIQREMYMMSRAELLQALDHIAEHVNTIANGNPAIIAKAGFKPTYIHTNNNNLNPLAPRRVRVISGKESGTIIIECETYGLEHFYGCIVSEDKTIKDINSLLNAGLFKLPAGQNNTLYFEFNHNRRKTIKGLTKGKEYFIYYFVINHTGVSPFSEPELFRCE